MPRKNKDLPQSYVSGITYDARTAKWLTKYRKDGVLVYLGRFDDLDDAVVAQRNAERGERFEKPRPASNPYRGVSFDEVSKVWKVRISIAGAMQHVGNFKDAGDAVAARKAAEDRRDSLPVTDEERARRDARQKAAQARKERRANYGISWDKTTASYKVRAVIDGKRRYVGGAKTLDEARSLRRMALGRARRNSAGFTGT